MPNKLFSNYQKRYYNSYCHSFCHLRKLLHTIGLVTEQSVLRNHTHIVVECKTLAYKRLSLFGSSILTDNALPNKQLVGKILDQIKGKELF